MRESDAFIAELDFVAEIDGEIVGNIVYSKAVIHCDSGAVREAVCFGPVSVLPNFQSQGVGSTLILHSLQRARELGYEACLIYGDPDYYGRFGFRKAEVFDIRTPDDQYAVPLLALELKEDALKYCSGRFIEDEVYDIDDAAAAKFDKSFPVKELRDDLPSQKRFLELVAMRRARV